MFRQIVGIGSTLSIIGELWRMANSGPLKSGLANRGPNSARDFGQPAEAVLSTQLEWAAFSSFNRVGRVLSPRCAA